MDPASPLRIYQPTPSDADGPDLDPHRLAARELLRPPAARSPDRDLEPFSRAWFEELELKRYAPPGVWLRRMLEFTRHAGESLVMVGPGAGTDALQYQRHGVAVTACVGPSDHPDLLRRNFDLRGQTVRVVHTGPAALPFERGTFDLAYLNLLHGLSADPPAAVRELYRVLKPGGKVFALAPAYYDPGFWQHILLPFRRWYRPPVGFTDAPRYSGRELRRLFGLFTECRVAKRHLRRSELPHLWRFVPTGVLERLIGRVMVLRAFKPISAALEAAAGTDAA
jgi:SAM-dependent methyltransferase